MGRAAPTLLAGRYRLGAEIGRGGMGVVFEAAHQGLGRPVAIKRLRLAERSGQSRVRALARFRREARAAAQLEHPHIVNVLDMGVDQDDQPYLVMEKLEGSTLAECGSLSGDNILLLASQLCQALEAAHQERIVHRDLTPRNVFLVAGKGPGLHAKVLDFGLAKGSHLDGTLKVQTRAGASIGTPAYMAPEQVRGESVDARADLYALGAVLYFALTGVGPHHGKRDLFFAALHEPVPLLDGPMGTLIAELMAKDPGDRPSSAGAVRERVLRLSAADLPRRVKPTVRPSAMATLSSRSNVSTRGPMAKPRHRRLAVLLPALSTLVLFLLFAHARSAESSAAALQKDVGAVVEPRSLPVAPLASSVPAVDLDQPEPPPNESGRPTPSPVVSRRESPRAEPRQRPSRITLLGVDGTYDHFQARVHLSHAADDLLACVARTGQRQQALRFALAIDTSGRLEVASRDPLGRCIARALRNVSWSPAFTDGSTVHVVYRVVW